MKSIILVIISIACLALVLAACDPAGSGSKTYSNRQDLCGHLGEPCCQDMNHRDPYGNWQPISFCYDYLDCRMDLCVEGPEYQTYDRNSGGYY